jgi:hypothetical protein
MAQSSSHYLSMLEENFGSIPWQNGSLGTLLRLDPPASEWDAQRLERLSS